ncbi:MAG: radical SAM protein [Desulfurococcaceae archaeon]
MKTLEVIREFDPWKSPLCTCPRKYSLHPYTGCSHFCLYCYAVSYIGLKESTPKIKFLNKLARDLGKIEKNSIIELSTSSDPYPPVEENLKLTRHTLEILVRHNVKILITTKSNLVVRDSDVIKRAPASVMITITTLDDKLARIIEPNAPPPSDRIKAVEELRKQGVPVGVRIDPVIPFINDDPHDLKELATRVIQAGALHIVTSSFKAKMNNLKRLSEYLPRDIANKLISLYREKGTWIHGYLYLNTNTRRSMLQPVITVAREYGITYATCREGLMELFNAPTCDGSHLINFNNFHAEN